MCSCVYHVIYLVIEYVVEWFFLNMVHIIHELVTLPFFMVFYARKDSVSMIFCKNKISTFFSVNFFPLLLYISPIYTCMYTGKADVQSKYFC